MLCILTTLCMLQAATTVVVTQQPVVQQPVVFRDRPVVVIDSNGQQVQSSALFLNKLFL